MLRTTSLGGIVAFPTFFLFSLFTGIRGESLTPPYFNLAEGKHITATATCGEGIQGPELYCKLIGANSENDLTANVIQGQYCDVCDPARSDKKHPAEFAVDGRENWWQSPPLSRGMKYNEVNLTIDLGQEFHVAYVYIKMANSPRPGLWILEKSADYGKTYTPWQYFSDSAYDCETFFGRESLQPIVKDNSVICTTEYSKIVPLEGGEIPISLLNKRPSANHYFNSSVLQEWTRATNVRLRFLRTKNLLGHLMSVARQDPTVTRRYFYSIKEISIGGRCMCNGHADACDIPDSRDSRVLLCNCKHNTCGAKCDVCCPGFEQKAWRQSKHDAFFRCEPCNCYGHSDECEYDKEVDKKHLSLDIHEKYDGGGVCKNCRDNTEGINCNKCKPTFFRPYNKHWNETDVCQRCQCDVFYSTGNCAEGSGRCECRKEYVPPNCDSCSFGYYGYPNCRPCDCYLNGTLELQCAPLRGECTCKHNFGGSFCKECASGYFNFPQCTECQCNPQGSESNSCNQESGACTCKNKYDGVKCEHCRNGYFYKDNDCTYCDCDSSGTEPEICNKTNGSCICKPGYGGARCDTCLLGYYGYPDCKPCDCSKKGSHGSSCSTSGKCSCLSNYAGKTCNQCSPGYFNYPDCNPCDCDGAGSIGISCDQNGKCECKPNFDGQHCDLCKEGYYNYPACEDCNCHPAGVVEGFAGCGSVPEGELCQCKERVEGRICDKCKPLFWNLNLNNPNGCEDCKCNTSGVLGGIGVCDGDDGQCVCKPSVISRSCSICADGTYGLNKDNLFGCTDCGCDVGGSVNNFCNKLNGQCQCQPRVEGRTCKEPLQAHYFPTLYQYQYEVEDGRTPENSKVRYEHNENVFANYSWKGYAVFTNLLQSEVVQEINIIKPSLYRMVFRFVNPNPYTVIGGIRIVPENPSDIEQYIPVQFRNSSQPAFVTVSGDTGNIAKPFVMNPGRWTVIININQTVFLDYFVLLPEDFYLATILNQKVEKACTIGEQDLCRHHAYPNVTSYDKSWGVGGFGPNRRPLVEWFKNTTHLYELKKISNKVPMLNPVQPQILLNISVHKAGDYVLVIDYLTPLDDLRTHEIEVTKQSKEGKETGRVILYSCPYTTMCRQVITNENRGVAIYNVNENYISINITGVDANVGIHSVIAIPYEDWSLDFITPKPVCIRKNGECIPTTFPNPPETKKIPFDQEIMGEIGKNKPPIKELYNNSYVWLNPSDKSIDIRGKVPFPGDHSFIVHYYQPHSPAFDLDVIIQNGAFYEAKVSIEHCPSQSGCRAVVNKLDGKKIFNITENFMITLKQQNDKEVYLDYLLVVPADLYNEQNLEPETVDRTGEFISQCGNNHFNIDTSVKGFCRDSVFSITAGHNTGALPCQCDYVGSLSFECEKFGGQCQCKENIIGRKCEACKTGHYGFPDCKPCNCPSTAYCEPTTGECVCPPHVIGENCDQCEPLTYGFHSSIGCEECKCDYLGVIGNNLQCDVVNGSCPCKENIFGRTCDKCKPGTHSFPYCESCECNVDGTIADICDNTTAECFCKKNVVGPHCEFCREGSFNLEASNEDGCTECFCFGKTTRCTSSRLLKVALNIMRDWEVVSLDLKENLIVTSLNIDLENLDENSNEVAIDFSYVNTSIAYFSAPDDYLGKKLVSYGGFLNYTIYYEIGKNGTAVSAPDIILLGRDIYLTYSNFEQPPAQTEFLTSLQLIENNFEIEGEPARREHLMEVLRDLRGIYLRATYWTATVSTRLSNVLLDEAYLSDDYYENSPVALSVEQCHCPPNYQGLSCEECAPGYYRILSGPHGGYCAPCECHGHAEECDVNTGICLNCMHNTKGDHCELCETGYHGNALAGTPNDCLICACPLPITSNNFATACDLSSDGEKISCQCREGYIGARCHFCAPGYFGRPDQPGDYCKPCQCSGNINPRDPSSCDTVTGACLKCLNNTYGEQCAQCAPTFFGDAVGLKDCQPCICDDQGTDLCDSYTGKCVCKSNVIGEKCDRCEFEHYGFQSGRGCQPCKCGEASESNQCEDLTGQCKCKPGVTGRTCDRCAAGFWNYTSEGCISCGCKSEYSLGLGCNALTGQCECLEGVIGEKCDQCPHRWAFEPNFGCHRCDTCHHALLNDTDLLAELIDPIIKDFDTTQSGYFTRRRLENMREQLENLKPKLDEINPSDTSLNNPLEEVERLEQDAKALNRKSNYSLENSEEYKNKSETIKNKIEELLDEISLVEEEAIKTAEDIDKIFTELHEQAGNEVDKALKEGEAILDIMKTYNLTQPNAIANNSLKKVVDLLKNVTEFKIPVENLKEQVDEVEDNLKNFNKKLDNLYNHTQFSLNMAKEAEDIIGKIGKDRLKNKLDDIEDKLTQSKVNLDDSDKFLANASSLLEVSVKNLKDLLDAPDALEYLNNDFGTNLDNNKLELETIEALKPQVQEHASTLSERVQQLEHILSESQFGSQDAVKAARAYKDIVAAVRSAREAADSAKNDTNHAAEILNNVQERTNDAETNSDRALDDSYELKQFTNDQLEPKLKNATEKYVPVEELLNNAGQMLKEIQNILENLQVQDLEEGYKVAAKNAEDALWSVREVKGIVSSNYNDLPKETEQAQLLPKEVDDMHRNLEQTERQINAVNEKFPPVLKSLDELPVLQTTYKQKSDAIRANVKKLTQQIDLARDIANRIKVGVKFFTNTTLELRNPKNLEALSTSSKFSGYFKTQESQGLIFYIGNPNATNIPKQKTEDYMALIIQNGYPVLNFNIGNGNEQIINQKYVADNNWYQYIIERVGFNAKLSIREELQNGSEVVTTNEKSLSGPYTVFNLDDKHSRIFVGSIPNNYQVPEGLDSRSFDGEMEDLVIGNTPVSLWNFNYGYENNHGAKERNKLVNLAPSNGYRFNGNGYAILESRSLRIRTKSTIQLNFKTYTPTGLLFLAGKEKTFISIQIQNGKILFQYNLGGETKKWVTSKKYNDGNWHKITAIRDGPKGKLIVDTEDVIDRTKDITGTTLEYIDTISFGGYPNRHNYPEVTEIRFDGCIVNVTINAESIDLRNNIKAFNVEPGCPDKWSSMVSFGKDNDHYVGWDQLSLTNEFNMSLKFKTSDKDGLIFYVSDQTQENSISLSLKDGYLILVDQKIKLTSKGAFNDSKWHVVSVIHKNAYLRMDIDDEESEVTDAPPPFIHALISSLYVGGLPNKIRPQSNAVASNRAFYGCIADLTVNGKVKNFANTTDRHTEILDKCVLDEPEDINHPLPELKPIETNDYYTTEISKITTVNVNEEYVTVRGDGGNDFRPINPPQTEGPIIEAEPPVIEQEPTTTRRIGTLPPTTVPPPRTDQCALSPNPQREDIKIVGYRFGTHNGSRLEFNVARGKYRKAFDFRFEFRTRETEGVMFYVSDIDARAPSQEHKHYAAVYLSGGQVMFVFKADGEPAVLKSDRTYNDDKWHLVEFEREGASGKLVIDQDETVSGSTAGSKSLMLNLRLPFFIGGIAPELYNSAQIDLNTTATFFGCIRSISMNNKPLDISAGYGLIPCTDNVEVGTYFGGGMETYVKLKDKFKVGQMFNIKLDIKPRVESGVLIAAHGKKDYYVLELLNGTVRLHVENGKGPITAVFIPPNNNTFHLCDGKWHNIQAVKSKNVVTLSVDNLYSDPRIGPHALSTDTGSALFLGGHRLIKKVRGIHSRTPYIGCIKNIEINNEPWDLSNDMGINGNVTIGFCPTF
ncbi:laminin subunit alpha [Diorhabda carinulata]|uniref:laminin subunit alpha n=1 Tax=Diorhabda carinulata TaxID=1163345 RepID=UPI0025A17109|nr:laminin subunit alpha [Diorhabda carinulata]